MRNNKYYIDESLLQDNEIIGTFFYLNKSPYHRRQKAYEEKENRDIRKLKQIDVEKRI